MINLTLLAVYTFVICISCIGGEEEEVECRRFNGFIFSFLIFF
jgi:hypothetical protein